MTGKNRQQLLKNGNPLKIKRNGKFAGMSYSRQITIWLFAGTVALLGLLLVKCNPASPAKTAGELMDTAEAKQLGQYLFYDRRLSVNYTKACATCHNPEFAFTDGYKRSLGAFADLHQRNSTPLFNLQYSHYLTAADSSLHSLEQQMNQPLFGRHPAEMGAGGNEKEILARFKNDQQYKRLFTSAFPVSREPIIWNNIKIAISQFVLSIQSNDAPYDRYIRGDSNAISSTQKKGMQLFFSTKFKCNKCHGGQNFSEPSFTDSMGKRLYYFNTGLYNISGNGDYPAYDQGLYQHTKRPADMGRYRVPPLRNLVFTSPYFHDGSAATIKEAVSIFLEGGRNITHGIFKGDGTKSPVRDSTFIGIVNAGEAEKNALIDFLYSLSDSAFLRNKAFGNPFTEDETKKK